MSNWIADQVGSLAGDLEYVFGGGSQLQADATAGQSANQAAANADYAPGGRLYNQIQATRGTAAADQAWAAVQGDYASQGTTDVLAQEQQAGQEGANQGLNNVAALPGKVAGGLFDFSGSTLSGLLKAVPWWAWLLGIGAAALYLLGPAFLVSRARKAIGA